MDLWSSHATWGSHARRRPAVTAPADAVVPPEFQADLRDADDGHDDDHHHHDHAEEPLTPAAAVVMWVTVLLPYVGLAALAAWVVTLPLGWFDLAALVVCYLAVGFGVTIGYHRLLAHRAFHTYRWIEAVFIILGSMAMQGPPMRWAATHRRHHQKSDRDGDPHSPHLHGSGAAGVLRGLWHAHTGWLLTPDCPDTERSMRDAIENPVVQFVDRNYKLWLALSVVLPVAAGWAVKGSFVGGLVTLFWCTILRIALMHHATWSVNSICHFFGYQSFKSNDHSRNNPIIAVISLGEGWHNNHHAFPTSARHGMRWFEVDLSYIVIRTLELTGLVWDVRRPTAQAMRQRSTAAPAPAAA